MMGINVGAAYHEELTKFAMWSEGVIGELTLARGKVYESMKQKLFISSVVRIRYVAQNSE